MVSGMSQRLRILHLISHPPSGVEYSVGRPVRPKVWEDNWESTEPQAYGIRQMEKRWDDTATSGRPFTRTRPRDSTVLSHASSHATWMDPSPARLPPRLRAAAAQRQHCPPTSTPPHSLNTPRATQQNTRQHNDTVDLARPDRAIPPWTPVYKVISDRRLPRDHRETAWRLLHGFLPCGAFLLHINPNADTDAASACTHLECHGAAANLTHIFTTCQLAEDVVTWLCDVWTAIEPGNRPPHTFAAIAVVGDFRVFYSVVLVVTRGTLMRVETPGSKHISLQARSEHPRWVPITFLLTTGGETRAKHFCFPFEGTHDREISGEG